MQIRNPTLTLAVLAVAFAAAAGCSSSRDTACRGAIGAQAEQDGLQASLTCCRQDAGGLHARLTIRNTTDRDVMLGKGAEASSPVMFDNGSKQVAGLVYLERQEYVMESPPSTTLVRVPGQLRINCHTSETVRVDVPGEVASDASAPWRIRVAGSWSTGVPVLVQVPVSAPKVPTNGS
jgi:hypothetical protein